MHHSQCMQSALLWRQLITPTCSSSDQLSDHSDLQLCFHVQLLMTSHCGHCQSPLPVACWRPAGTGWCKAGRHAIHSRLAPACVHPPLRGDRGPGGVDAVGQHVAHP
jgi:hypothetical protein